MTGSYSPLSREDRVQIEVQVLQHQREIARLNYRLNQDVAFMRLSNELIAEIFMHCAADWHSRPSAQNLIALQRWLPITIVCQHWRDVALSTPSLWAFICVGTHDRLTSMFLERSSEAYLSVHGKLYVFEDHSNLPSDVDPFHKWQPLSQAAFRIRSLNVEIPTTNAPPIHHHTSIPPFSALRYLDIASSLSSPFAHLLRLPPFLISDEIHLVSLKAQRFPLTVVQPLMKACLRSLCLRSPCMVDRSWAALLDTLKVLTGLEELELDGGFPPPQERHTNLYPILGQTVTLPRLRSLSVKAELPYTAALLLHQFVFPREAAAIVKYSDANDLTEINDLQDDDGIKSLALAVSQRLSGGSTPSPRSAVTSLRIDSGSCRHNDRAGVLSLFSFIAQSNDTPSESGTVAPVICIEGQYKIPVLLIKLKLSSASAFHELRTLDVSHCLFLDRAPKFIHAAFAHLPSISIVRASGASVVPIMRAMVPDLDNETKDCTDPFPALTVLSIREFCLWEAVEWDEDEQGHVNLIEQALLCRSPKRGYRLDELVLENCIGVIRDMLDVFEEHVRQVTWDGRGLMPDN